MAGQLTALGLYLCDANTRLTIPRIVIPVVPVSKVYIPKLPVRCPSLSRYLKMASSQKPLPLIGVNPYTEVRLPDLFILFLSEPPAVNLHYADVRGESEAWIAQ